MSEFKGTKVNVFALQYGGVIVLQDEDFYQSNHILNIDDLGEEVVKANVDLIIDAFKVRQQINCELSELKEQRDEMLEMLESQLTLCNSMLKIQGLWLPKGFINEEFSSEYIALCSMLNSLEENKEFLQQLIKKVKDNE